MNTSLLKTNLQTLIKDLCLLSSPSGYEDTIRSYILNLLTGIENVSVDKLGNIIIKKIGQYDKSIMLIAHCDEIGFSVKYIDENGFVFFSPIGGVDLSILKGQSVSIRHNNDFINGVIGTQPIHLKKNSKNKNSDIDISDLWIDIGNTSKDLHNTVSVGDPITFYPNFKNLQNCIFSSKSIDNRVGLSVLLSVLKRLLVIETYYNIVFVISVQEELGLRGAKIAGYGINPDYCIAIDVTHATDYPTIDKRKNGDIRLDGGCVIPIGSCFDSLTQNTLRKIAAQKSIHFQIESLPGVIGVDATDIQLTRNGVLTGFVGIPCRYMHSPIEVASYNDITGAIDLLTEYCMRN